MTIHDITSIDGDLRFTVGNSKIVWEAASYNKNQNLYISRVCKEGEKGGTPWIMGMRQKIRRANPESKATIVK